jgi:hypothetical protein
MVSVVCAIVRLLKGQLIPPLKVLLLLKRFSSVSY